MYHTSSYLCQALRYFCVFSHRQMPKKKKKRKLWLLTAQSCTFECTCTHTQSNPSSQLFSIKMSFVSECRPCCLDLAETSQAVETWLLCSRGIDRTGVPRRWQGQQLIGPKWEWRGRLIAIDPLLPPAGSSIFDYDHFTPNQVCASCDGGNPIERY